MNEMKQKPMAVKAMEYLKGSQPGVNEERFALFLALCQICENDSNKALGILLADEALVKNVCTASTWEEVYQNAYSFADQLASMPLDSDHDMMLAEKGLADLKALKPEVYEAYFTYVYGCYLFPELNLSFCINKSVVKMLGLPYPGEYEVD